MMETKTTATVDYRGIGAFVALAYGLAWLVVSPLWISGEGLKHQYALPIMAAMMFTPTIAAYIVVQFISRPRNMRRTTGLHLGKGRRWGWYWLFAWLVIPALVVAAPFVGALFGLYPLDVVNFSGYRALLEQDPRGVAALQQSPIQVLVLAPIISALITAPILNVVTAFGEEWGWRGYLLPKLLPLGQWPALLLSGAIWGLWHAPVILIGYNYPLHPYLGVALMAITCMILGVLLGWTRLATGSVWPAVIGHGALNGMAGVIAVLPAKDAQIDTLHVGILGWTGWLLPLLLIALLALTRRLPVANPPGLAGTPAEQPAPVAASAPG